MPTDQLNLLARCVRGLEWVCADEVGSTLPEAENLVMEAREVRFSLPELEPSVLALRTVDDVFLSVGEAGDLAATRDVPPRLAHLVGALDWSGAVARIATLRELPGLPAFDVVASLDGNRSFTRFDVEHAVGRVLAGQLCGSYLPRSPTGRPAGEPDLSVRILIRGGRALAAVRLSRRPLHRREYKQETGRGTLHPPLAAALCRLAAPTAGQTLTDPFCGDGTIPIEAALSVAGLNMHAFDLDPVRIANARRNAARAGVTVDFRQADAGRPGRSDPTVDVLVTNPPWNVTVDGAGSLSESLTPFWERLPDLLAAEGRLCMITDAALDVPSQLRRTGFQEVLSTRIRLAGRVSDVLLGAPAGWPRPQLPAGAAHWRRRALAEGTATDEGF